MAVETAPSVNIYEPFEFVYDPANPKIVNVEYGGQERMAVELIGEKDLDTVIDYVSYQVSLAAFDHIMILSEGGFYLANELSRRQDYVLGSHNTSIVSTTRPPGGGEAIIDNPDLLDKIADKKVLVIDDLVDSAGTLATIFARLPNASGVAIAQKVLDQSDTHYYRQQEVLRRTVVGAKIPNLWVGGAGLDYGSVAENLHGYKKGYPRWIRKIVIMAESLIEDNRQY